jgi:hypothetical protein
VGAYVTRPHVASARGLLHGYASRLLAGMRVWLGCTRQRGGAQRRARQRRRHSPRDQLVSCERELARGGAARASPAGVSVVHAWWSRPPRGATCSRSRSARAAPGALSLWPAPTPSDVTLVDACEVRMRRRRGRVPPSTARSC